MTRPTSIRRLAKRLLRRALLLALYVVFAILGFISAAGRLFRTPKPPRPEEVQRILVIRLDLLGDLVLSLPTIYALKQAYSEAEVTLLALPYAAGLLELAPEVDRVLTYDVNRVRRPREVLSPRHWA
ncbi:MAG TPA: hypothetical protein VF157_00165 [Chloroflexota bacterium]